MAHNLLLLNGDRTAPIALAEADPDIRLIALTSPRHRHRYAPETRVEIVDDLADLWAVRKAVFRILETTRIDSVVAATEYSLQAAGYISSLFGIPGIPYETANRFSNKFVMKCRLREAGIPVAPFDRVDNFDHLPAVAARIGPDLILKPALGSGTELTKCLIGADVQEFPTSPAAEELRKRPVPFLAERLLDVSAEYHCDGIVHDGKVLFSYAGRYASPLIRHHDGALVAGQVLRHDTSESVAIRELHERVVAALGLVNGVTHMEVLEVAGERVVGEITCRPGGAGLPGAMRACHGIDVWRAFLDLAMGRRPHVNEGPGEHHVVWLLLPPGEGRVTALSSEADLLSVPGVVHAEVSAKLGTVLRGPRYSSSALGLVVARVDDPGKAPDMITRVLDRFRSTTTLTPVDDSGEPQ